MQVLTARDLKMLEAQAFGGEPTHRADVQKLINNLRVEREVSSQLRAALAELVSANRQHHNAPADWDRLDAALDVAAVASYPLNEDAKWKAEK